MNAHLPRFSRFLPALSAALAALLVNGCFSDDPKGTEVENELRSGALYYADGKPASGAKVSFFPVGYAPVQGDSSAGNFAAYSTRTNGQGLYQWDSLAAGEYNVLGEAGELRSYQDSLFINPATRSLPPDTLLSPGGIAGVVALEPQHDPRTVTIQALGTSVYANVDTSGRFLLAGLAEGRYRLKVSTTLPEYTQLFVGADIQSGIRDTLGDTLVLPYTGIPVVRDLWAAYDTLQGRIHLHWGRVAYRLFSDYLIYVDTVPVLVPATVPFAATADTFATFQVRAPAESLALLPAFDGGFPAVDTNPSHLRFQVRVRSRTSEEGQPFATSRVAVVTPAMVRTYFTLRSRGPHGMKASLGDTVALILGYRNLGRKIDSVFWSVEGSGETLRRARASRKQGEDTAIVVVPREAGLHRIRFTAKDEAGVSWSDRADIDVVEDRPSAFAGGDTSLTVGPSLTLGLRGAATDGFGSVRKWEWSINGQGFVPVSGPDTVISLPSVPILAYLCILRVTDDDGFTALDTMRVALTPWRAVRPMLVPRIDPAAAELDGKIYVIGGSDGYHQLASMEVYDTATDSWSLRAPLSKARSSMGIVVRRGKIVVVGGFTHDIGVPFEEIPTNLVEEYDPATDSWSQVAKFRVGLARTGAALRGDTLILVGGVDHRDYVGTHHILPIGDTAWTSRGWVFMPMAGPMATLGARLFSMGINAPPFRSTRDVKSYDTDGGLVLPWAPMPTPRFFPGLVGAKGRIYALGGVEESEMNDPRSPHRKSKAVEILDPETNSWSTGYPMPERRSRMAVVHSGDRIFVLGGVSEDDWPMRPIAGVLTLPLNP